MKRIVIALLMLLGAGCAGSSMSDEVNVTPDQQDAVLLPVERYVDYRYSKAFGEYISDRFEGYHVADDVEFEFVEREIPVHAIMDGTVVQIGDVSGYGGVILIDHGNVNAIYGHIDLSSSTLKEGDEVVTGQYLADLGENRSEETDGERKHLHFGLYEGEPVRINGYEQQEPSVARWINPQNFFVEQGVDMTASARTFTATDLGGDIFHLEFTVPAGMEVEYIPSLQALNIFTLDGEGMAQDRSEMLIRYFDADRFLTLSTVTVHSTTDLQVGDEGYIAKRYDIEKKVGIADFPDQPDWRNARHIVTDFTAAEGYGRYYVVAANPNLATAIYEEFLASIKITQ